MSLLRVFIAIDLPIHICGAIQKQTGRLRQVLGNEYVRWVPTQNMHLTLQFLGDTSTSHLDFLNQMLVREAGAHPQFDMQLAGLGAFPNRHNPRLLWIGIQAPPDLVSLHRSIEGGASRLGYKTEEDRAFSPHLTIGRARQNAGPGEMQKIHTALDEIQLGNIGTARIDSVHLFKSDLQAGGSIYTKLFSAPLSKS